MIIETASSPRRFSPPLSLPAPSARRARRPFLAAACWCYLLLLIAACFVMRTYGDRWWVATVLLNAPRWPLALPLIALGPWLLLARRCTPLIPTLAAVAVLLVPIMGFRIALPNSDSPRADVRLLSCNVHRKQLNPPALAAFIADASPDIIALQDWSDANQETLFAGGGWNLRREGQLFVASRFPIAAVTPLDIADDSDAPKGERGAAALFEFTTPRGPIHLINLHLASPHGGLVSFSADSGGKLAGNVERRWHESRTLRALADRVPAPLLLAGDFNTTDDSPIFRENWGSFADAFAECGSGFGYTYLINHTQLRIDHILAGPGLRFVRCRVGPEVGSPHRPLVADVNCR